MNENTKTTIYVCRTCRDEGFTGEDKERPGNLFSVAVANILADEGTAAEFDVKAVDCLSVCKRPCTVAFCAEGKFTYVIGDLQLDRDEDAVADFAKTYAESENGITPWRSRPEVVRKGTVARIPPLGATGSLISEINTDDTD